MHTSILNQQQTKQFEQDGFLILENFITPAQCDLLMQRASHLIDVFNPDEVKVMFSTTNPVHAKQRYFLDSGEHIHFFFEEGALDEQGQLTCDKSRAINKIGHALHELDPVFNCFSRQHKIACLLHDLNVADPRLVQSMYICKQPHIGGEVICHQDSTYIHTETQPVIGLWFALEDATIENGCLWALPGGHHTALKSRFIRDDDDNIRTETYDAKPFATDHMQPLPVKKGSVIVLHGLLPHRSAANHSAHSRHAYALHVISGKDTYLSSNWLRRRDHQPFHGFIA